MVMTGKEESVRDEIGGYKGLMACAILGRLAARQDRGGVPVLWDPFLF